MVDWWSTFKKKIKEPDLLTTQMGGMDIADLPADARITDSGILDANWQPYPVEKRSAVERLGEVGAQMLPLAGGMIAPPQGMTLGAGPKLPKMVEGYHGTWNPEIFNKPSITGESDMGLHIARSPNVSDYYASYYHEYPTDFPLRTYPVVADAKNPLKGTKENPIIDPLGNWRSPYEGISAMGYNPETKSWHDSKVGSKALRSDLEDLHVSSMNRDTKQWGDQLIPLLQSHGHDAIKYQHGSGGYLPEGDAYMMFNADQIHPRYSPEAAELIRHRGISPAIKKPSDYLFGADNPLDVINPYHGMNLTSLPPYLRGRR